SDEVATSAASVSEVSTFERGEAGQSDSFSRSIPILSASAVGVVLRANGFTHAATLAIERVLSGAGISTFLAAGTELRVLYGPTRDGQRSIAYRVAFHMPGAGSSESFGVALTDAGRYVLIDRQEDEAKLAGAADGKEPRWPVRVMPLPMY